MNTCESHADVILGPVVLGLGQAACRALLTDAAACPGLRVAVRAVLNELEAGATAVSYGAAWMLAYAMEYYLLHVQDELALFRGSLVA